MNKSSNSIKNKQVMSNKPSRSCKFICTEEGCKNTWFSGSEEPSWFAKKWPGTCEECERKQKTERVAKEKKRRKQRKKENVQ